MNVNIIAKRYTPSHILSYIILTIYEIEILFKNIILCGTSNHYR